MNTPAPKALPTRNWPASPCQIHVSLDSCPLCGAAADCWNYIVEAAVQCVSCGLTVTRKHKPGNDDSGVDEAIAAWNRRTASPAEGRMGGVPSKLAADLQGIANGELPDGDGVDTSVSLWAERWLERLATSPADPPATLGEVDGEVDALLAELTKHRNLMPCGRGYGMGDRCIGDDPSYWCVQCDNLRRMTALARTLAKKPEGRAASRESFGKSAAPTPPQQARRRSRG